jgi:uncharacterized protein
MEKSMNKCIQGWATLELKSFGEGKKGVISGLASHIAPDRSGDVVVPSGLKFKLPIPLKFEHQEIVGHIYAAEVTSTGVAIEAQLADPDEAQSQTIKERLLMAWDSVRMGLAKGLSVGMLPIKAEPMGRGFGYKYLEAELLEVSIVGIPDQARASISVVKSYGQRSIQHGYVQVDMETVRRVCRDDGAVHA